MTIKELKEALAELGPEHDDTAIICQRDSEGNGYSPLMGIERAYYIPNNAWSGDVLAPQEVEEREPEDFNLDDVVPCFVVWPNG